jgi:hypothetical protein
MRGKFFKKINLYLIKNLRVTSMENLLQQKDNIYNLFKDKRYADYE